MLNHRIVASDRERTSLLVVLVKWIYKSLSMKYFTYSGGSSWRVLPHELPPLQTFYNYFGYWQRLEVGQKIHIQLGQQVRKYVEKTDAPTAGIIDSQSVKNAEKRRKCTIMVAANELRDASDLSRVDTLGLLLAVIVIEANFPKRLEEQQ